MSENQEIEQKGKADFQHEENPSPEIEPEQESELDRELRIADEKKLEFNQEMSEDYRDELRKAFDNYMTSRYGLQWKQKFIDPVSHEAWYECWSSGFYTGRLHERINKETIEYSKRNMRVSMSTLTGR